LIHCTTTSTIPKKQIIDPPLPPRTTKRNTTSSDDRHWSSTFFLFLEDEINSPLPIFFPSKENIFWWIARSRLRRKTAAQHALVDNDQCSRP